jgi:hypothetical protein
MQLVQLRLALDEEDRDVVSDNIPVALLSIELDGESTNIPDSVCGTAATEHGGESEEDRGLARCVSEDTGRCDVGGRFEEGEFSEGTGATGVDYALGDTFVVEPVDLSCQLVVAVVGRSPSIPSHERTGPPRAVGPFGYRWPHSARHRCCSA